MLCKAPALMLACFFCSSFFLPPVTIPGNGGGAPANGAGRWGRSWNRDAGPASTSNGGDMHPFAAALAPESGRSSDRGAARLHHEGGGDHHTGESSEAAEGAVSSEGGVYSSEGPGAPHAASARSVSDGDGCGGHGSDAASTDTEIVFAGPTESSGGGGAAGAWRRTPDDGLRGGGRGAHGASDDGDDNVHVEINGSLWAGWRCPSSAAVPPQSAWASPF